MEGDSCFPVYCCCILKVYVGPVVPTLSSSCFGGEGTNNILCRPQFVSFGWGKVFSNENLPSFCLAFSSFLSSDTGGLLSSFLVSLLVSLVLSV